MWLFLFHFHCCMYFCVEFVHTKIVNLFYSWRWLLLLFFMNTSALTPGAQVQEFLQRIYLGVELLGLGMSTFNIYYSGLPIYTILSTVAQVSDTWYFRLKVFARLWNFISWPKFVFSWLLIRLNSVLYAYGPFVFSLWAILLQLFCPLFNWMCCLVLTNLWDFLMYPGH